MQQFKFLLPLLNLNPEDRLNLNQIKLYWSQSIHIIYFTGKFLNIWFSQLRLSWIPHSHFLKMFTLVGNYTLKRYCLLLNQFLPVNIFSKKKKKMRSKFPKICLLYTQYLYFKYNLTNRKKVKSS